MQTDTAIVVVQDGKLVGMLTDRDITVRAVARGLTPRYASPEQLQGLPLGTASDVYSMAVVLYQLLTGQKPYTLKRGTRAELEEAIVSSDPPRMSEAVRRRHGGERLARAMRENLRRRKAQQREREAGGSPDAEPVEEG